MKQLQPGRPKDEAKRSAMIEAAKALFFEQGFAATSIEAIAELAGVSKVTLYGHFGTKAALFEAVVLSVTERMESASAQFLNAPAPLREKLQAFGEILLNELMSPDLMKFDQNLAGELSAHPEMARRFFAAGPGRSRERLIKILTSAQAAGELHLDDPVLAANDLLGLWQSFASAETRFCMVELPDADGIKKRVTRGVDVFLRAYRT
jgi:TetR/AcrR family transcriptional regulator, mexJK operon transcriptional repressor